MVHKSGPANKQYTYQSQYPQFMEIPCYYFQLCGLDTSSSSSPIAFQRRVMNPFTIIEKARTQGKKYKLSSTSPDLLTNSMPINQSIHNSWRCPVIIFNYVD